MGAGVVVEEKAQRGERKRTISGNEDPVEG